MARRGRLHTSRVEPGLQGRKFLLDFLPLFCCRRQALKEREDGGGAKTLTPIRVLTPGGTASVRTEGQG
jgi:hypothetical protein